MDTRDLFAYIKTSLQLKAITDTLEDAQKMIFLTKKMHYNMHLNVLKEIDLISEGLFLYVKIIRKY